MFRFRLQRILELRERKQRDAATALVSAQTEAEQAREAQARLEAARAALVESSMPGAATDAASVGTLRNLHFLLERLDSHAESAASAADVAEQTVAQRQDELRLAFQERRTLDRLRERHEETWRATAAAPDRQHMD
jgi:flagellar export protein FliJ